MPLSHEDKCYLSKQRTTNQHASPETPSTLADCAIGFGHTALGGKGGQIYVFTDSSDRDAANPIPGTLHHAVIQDEPLWIIFSADMTMKLKHELIFNNFKTEARTSI